MRVLATRLSAVPSGKPMPTEELAPGLHDVALVDRVADVKRDGNAVADDGDAADDLFDLADGVGGCGRLRLRVLPGRRRSGEEIDDVGSKTGAVRRYQRRVFFARKISRDDVMAAVGPGYDEIRAPNAGTHRETTVPRRAP